MSSTVMNHERVTKAVNEMYQKLTIFVQALAAVGILVIAVISLMGQSTSELRIEMQEEFRSFREEMRSFRAEMQEEFKSVRAEMRSVRAEMKEEFKSVRAEMRSFRSEVREGFKSVRADIHDMNTRLGRVEGEVRALTQGREWAYWKIYRSLCILTGEHWM